MPEHEPEDASFLPVLIGGRRDTTMLCASIILPMTPPVELAVVMRIGFRPSCSAVIFCRLPNSTFELVSDPVSATPSQPSIAAKNG